LWRCPAGTDPLPNVVVMGIRQTGASAASGSLPCAAARAAARRVGRLRQSALRGGESRGPQPLHDEGGFEAGQQPAGSRAVRSPRKAAYRAPNARPDGSSVSEATRKINPCHASPDPGLSDSRPWPVPRGRLAGRRQDRGPRRDAVAADDQTRSLGAYDSSQARAAATRSASTDRRARSKARPFGRHTLFDVDAGICRSRARCAKADGMRSRQPSRPAKAPAANTRRVVRSRRAARP